MESKRIALGVRYDGSLYHGWQSQENLRTVQQSLEYALSRVANHPISLTCAGRTDAGVHATSQVVHFDTDVTRSDYSWVFGANSNLPADISVTWASEVSRDFHARYSATARRYRYVVFNHSIRPGILRHAVGWFHSPLDEKQMQIAGQHLVGKHDFSAYRGAGCQANTPIRHVQHIDVARYRRMVVIEIKANAFLLHMVRNIVGTLVAIGTGEQPTTWAKDVLESCDRRQGGVTIGPSGLYLVEVDYPEAFGLPKTPVGPFFLPGLEADI